MNMRAITRKTVGALALTVALTGLGAGVAEAKPSWGPRCASYHYAFMNYYGLAAKAFERGDTQSGRYYDRLGDNNYAAYVRVGCR